MSRLLSTTLLPRPVTAVPITPRLLRISTFGPRVRLRSLCPLLLSVLHQSLRNFLKLLSRDRPVTICVDAVEDRIGAIRRRMFVVGIVIVLSRIVMISVGICLVSVFGIARRATRVVTSFPLTCLIIVSI